MNFLLIALGVFVLFQFINGITNILTARYLRKQSFLQARIKEDENREMDEQREDIINKFSDIVEMLIDRRDQQNETESRLFRMEESLTEIYWHIMPQEEKKVRGKYKPRKPKVLEHKKTPPEN